MSSGPVPAMFGALTAAAPVSEEDLGFTAAELDEWLSSTHNVPRSLPLLTTGPADQSSPSSPATAQGKAPHLQSHYDANAPAVSAVVKENPAPSVADRATLFLRAARDDSCDGCGVSRRLLREIVMYCTTVDPHVAWATQRLAFKAAELAAQATVDPRSAAAIALNTPSVSSPSLCTALEKGSAVAKKPSGARGFFGALLGRGDKDSPPPSTHGTPAKATGAGAFTTDASDSYTGMLLGSVSHGAHSSSVSAAAALTAVQQQDTATVNRSPALQQLRLKFAERFAGVTTVPSVQVSQPHFVYIIPPHEGDDDDGAGSACEATASAGGAGGGDGSSDDLFFAGTVQITNTGDAPVHVAVQEQCFYDLSDAVVADGESTGMCGLGRTSSEAVASSAQQQQERRRQHQQAMRAASVDCHATLDRHTVQPRQKATVHLSVIIKPDAEFAVAAFAVVVTIDDMLKVVGTITMVSPHGRVFRAPPALSLSSLVDWPIGAVRVPAVLAQLTRVIDARNGFSAAGSGDLLPFSPSELAAAFSAGSGGGASDLDSDVPVALAASVMPASVSRSVIALERLAACKEMMDEAGHWPLIQKYKHGEFPTAVATLSPQQAAALALAWLCDHPGLVVPPSVFASQLTTDGGALNFLRYGIDAESYPIVMWVIDFGCRCVVASAVHELAAKVRSAAEAKVDSSKKLTSPLAAAPGVPSGRHSVTEDSIWASSVLTASVINAAVAKAQGQFQSQMLPVFAHALCLGGCTVAMRHGGGDQFNAAVDILRSTRRHLEAWVSAFVPKYLAAAKKGQLRIK